MEPQWFDRRTVERIHARQLELHGGLAGLRDPGMLESALFRPRNLWAYEQRQATLVRLAAAYAVGVLRNHPFLDGNKRTAAVVCEAFLLDNGWRLTADDDAWYAAIMGIAAGTISEDEFTEWLDANVEPIDGQLP